MEALIGTIMWVAFAFAPEGTVEANGQCMPINSNPALYSLLGPKYGGDNKTEFCVPDLRPMVNGQRDPNWNNGPRAVIVTSGIYPNRP
jgi:microcystin-dependent protein